MKKNLYFLGPNGTNCELAAQKIIQKFNFDVIYKPVSSIARAIDEAAADNGALLVLPIENSIEGIVRETVDNLLNCDIKILAQTSIAISHSLISKGAKNDIKTIVSHPQALNQCQNFIKNNFQNARLMSVNSTSYAVSMLCDCDFSYAAIASEFCAKMYGYEPILKNINDDKNNTTRFALLGNCELDLEKSRTSIVFSTKNEAGALLAVLEIFKKHDLNMIYLESRPNKKTMGEYVFFVDIDKCEAKIARALDEVKAHCSFYKFLGSYGEF